MILTNRKLAISIALLVLSTMATGCVYRVGDLTLVSTKNIDLTDVSLDVRQGQRKRAEDCRFALFNLIPFGLPNLEEAVDRALEAGGGNIMVDEVTEFKTTWVVVGRINCWVAEGTVLNIPPTVAKKPQPKAFPPK